MATTAAGASVDKPLASPDSDISPKSTIPPHVPRSEYFPPESTVAGEGSNTSARASNAEDDDNSSARKSSVSFVHDTLDRTTTLESPGLESVQRSNSNGSENSNDSRKDSTTLSRKASVSSVTICRPHNPSLPQGNPKVPLTGRRIREASPPPPEKFQHHVAFDNVPIGEATKNNTPSLTLNVRHKGYQPRRRSRTFMVGVDEHAYSDYALQWLLDELVDDGDEIVCVRVIEKDVRMDKAQYQEDGQSIMRSIQDRNGSNKAISIVLEYAVGKLHATFQKLIQMYSPAMLIVGTRGRSLGGIQGLVNTRNSFSKYCLQYSPVPVVVVRPTDKRIKKKTKRANDATRQTYVGMLAATHGKHEADSEASSTYELEVQISPDEEAHRVAQVLGLPASFDPTIKPINPGQLLHPKSPGPASINASDDIPEDQRVVQEPSNTTGDSDEEDEEDNEFETMTGQEALNQQKMEQLHKMEVGEAAALKMKIEDEDEDDDEGDDEQSNQKAAS